MTAFCALAARQGVGIAAPEGSRSATLYALTTVEMAPGPVLFHERDIFRLRCCTFRSGVYLQENDVYFHKTRDFNFISQYNDDAKCRPLCFYTDPKANLTNCLGLELGRPLPLPPIPVLIAPFQLRKRGIERLSPLDLLIPTLPHILTALPNLVPGILPPLLLPISRPYQLLLLLVPVTPRAHAEPEVAPVLRTRSHRPVAIEIVKLPAQRVAVESGIEGLPAAHGGGKELL